MARLESNGHQPVIPAQVIIKPEALARERLSGKKQQAQGKATVADPKLEEKRRKAREYYHANRERLAAIAKEKYRAKAKGGKAVRVIPQGDQPPAVPKRPNKVDALICINRSFHFLQQGDTEGAELWNRFAARIIQGKE